MVEEWQLALAKQIRCKVNINNIKQKDLAETIGVSEASMTSYVKCTRKPPVDVLMRIAETFNCTVDDLIHID